MLPARLRGEEFHEIALLWLILFNFVFSSQMPKPFIGLYALDIRASILMVGYIYASLPVASVVSRIPGAALANRYGVRSTVASGLLLNGVGLVVYGIASEPSLLLLGGALQGLGLGFFHPPMLSAIAKRRVGGLKREERVGYITTGAAAATMVGPAVGSFLWFVMGFRALFLVSAVVSVSAAAVTFMLMTDQPEEPRVLGGLDGIMGIKGLFSRGFKGVLVSRVSLNYAHGAMMTFIPLMAAGVLGMSVVEIGLLFTTINIFNFAARPLGGKLAARFGEERLLEAGLILIAVAAGVYASAVQPFAAWLGTVFYGLATGFFIPSSISYVGKIVPSGSQTYGMAVYSLMIDIGLFTGSIISASLLTIGGYYTVFLVASAVGLGGFTFQIFAFQRPFVQLTRQP